MADRPACDRDLHLQHYTVHAERWQASGVTDYATSFYLLTHFLTDTCTLVDVQSFRWLLALNDPDRVGWSGTRVRDDQTITSIHLHLHPQQLRMELLKTSHHFWRVRGLQGICTLCAKDSVGALHTCQVPSAGSLRMCMEVNHQGSSTNYAVSAELGIDIPGILKRSTCIASSRTRNLDLEGLDMGGPLIFVLLLACIHLLVSVPLRLFTVQCLACCVSMACTATAVLYAGV